MNQKKSKSSWWNRPRIVIPALVGILVVAAILIVVFVVIKPGGQGNKPPQVSDQTKPFSFVIDTRIDVNPDAGGAFGATNNEVVLQIGDNPDNQYVVNWGDGSKAELNVNRHVYAGDPAEYTVSIVGLLPGGIRFSVAAGDSVYGEKRLTKVLNSLLEEKGKDFSNKFYDCSNLTEIPEDLFVNNPNVTSFERAFAGCTSLQNIPEKLFAGDSAVTNFAGVFAGCTAVSSVPAGLFASNPAVTNFFQAFSGCAMTELPAGLFAKNPAVTSFAGAFLDCKLLQSIPENLFANNPAVTDCSYTFCGNIALQKIPAKLFANNPSVADFSGAFMFCTAVTGKLPELWVSHPNAAHVLTFSGVVNADNYAAATEAGWAD